MRLTSENSLLLIVDLQTGLLPVIDGGAQAVNEAGWLAGMADVVGVPVWVTEQSPEKIGASTPELLSALGEHQVWQKQHFSAMGEPDFRAALKATGKTQIVLCGAEAHICVLQTALDLQATGYAVYWLSEATASRRKEEARLARERACAGGAVGVSADMVAYEWIERCDTATFKQAHQTFLKRRAARPLTFF
ncbi:isochorismatase family protein [Vreelandella subglaciescola]|jgi:nicotinamidase-related amidase|uniref:Nicotinamidase-related amidase n=1 Tax=Vreelandella subglaciescola TaxID=29571 RepID=A0A1M7GEX5_9GAMM|nr:isochorismatase family protein [Halomonas subglaciescola]SHM14429.1 Nicotinamidase-related amidase [Halomonas subglaciescola]